MKDKRTKIVFAVPQVVLSTGVIQTLQLAGVSAKVIDRERDRAERKLAKRLDRRIRKAQKRTAKKAA